MEKSSGDLVLFSVYPLIYSEISIHDNFYMKVNDSLYNYNDDIRGHLSERYGTPEQYHNADKSESINNPDI